MDSDEGGCSCGDAGGGALRSEVLKAWIGGFVRKFLRRLRGIVGTALTWGVGWVVANALLCLVTGVPLQFLGPLSGTAMFQGFLAGGTFATILSIAERKRTLEELSLPRVALWGGIGGMLIGFLAFPFMVSQGFPLARMFLPVVVDGLIGAGFASGSVTLARGSDTALLGAPDPTRLLDDH